MKQWELAEQRGWLLALWETREKKQVLRIMCSLFIGSATFALRDQLMNAETVAFLLFRSAGQVLLLRVLRPNTLTV